MDTSVVVKWFKPGERYEAEAQDLRGRVERGEVQALACEILSLEVVRGLKKTQAAVPAAGIADADIQDAYDVLEMMVQTGILKEGRVHDMKAIAKDLEMTVGLATADALHLATAIQHQARYFVTDDRHCLRADVIQYAGNFGVRVVDLPGLIAALSTGAGPSIPPVP